MKQTREKLEALYNSLDVDERLTIDFALIILFRKVKGDTVSDEAMARYVHEVTEFVDLMKVVKAKFDSVAQTPTKATT